MTLKLIDPKTCYFASLDLGTKHTGISLFYSGEHRKSFTLENKDTNSCTLPVTMFKLLRERLTGNFTGRFVVAIEDYSYGGSRFFNTSQAEIVGQLKAFIRDNPEYALVMISPTSIKKIVTGSGKATKSQMKSALKSTGIYFADSHSADSYGVWLAYNSMWEAPSEAVLARSINVIIKEL